jgi:hypothetical protein
MIQESWKVVLLHLTLYEPPFKLLTPSRRVKAIGQSKVLLEDLVSDGTTPRHFGHLRVRLNFIRLDLDWQKQNDRQ